MTSLLWIYHNLGLETFWQRRFLSWSKVLQGKAENFTFSIGSAHDSWGNEDVLATGHNTTQLLRIKRRQWLESRKNIVEDLKLNTCLTFLLFFFQSLRYTPCQFVGEKWVNVTWMGVEPGHIATPPNSEPDGRGEPNDLMHLRRILEPATLIEDFPLNLKFANHDLRWPTQLRKISLNSEWVYAMSSSKCRPIWTFWLRHFSPPASYRAKGS